MSRVRSYRAAAVIASAAAIALLTSCAAGGGAPAGGSEEKTVTGAITQDPENHNPRAVAYTHQTRPTN